MLSYTALFCPLADSAALTKMVLLTYPGNAERGRDRSVSEDQAARKCNSAEMWMSHYQTLSKHDQHFSFIILLLCPPVTYCLSSSFHCAFIAFNWSPLISSLLLRNMLSCFQRGNSAKFHLFLPFQHLQQIMFFFLCPLLLTMVTHCIFVLLYYSSSQLSCMITKSLLWCLFNLCPIR